jgi:hypothetical protein
LSEAGKVQHERSVSFPKGARLSVEDFVALAKLAETSTKDVYWTLRLADRKLSGKGHIPLQEALQNVRGRLVGADFLATDSFMSNASVAVSLIGSSSHVVISGADLNWVAGARERFQEEIKHRVSVPLWWRCGGLPIPAFWGLLCAALLTSTITALTARGVVSVTATGLRVNAVWAAFVGALFAFFLSRMDFASPRLMLKAQTLSGRAWFQHPAVESAKTVAGFIGAAWAAIQIIRLFA